MCFSAEASFVGAAAAGGVGVATITQMRRPREWVYGSLPLAFGAHQLIEGLTWLELESDPGAVPRSVLAHVWVLYAWAVLPVWVPLGVRLLEPSAERRARMAPLLAVGAVVALVMSGGALRPEITVREVGGHLDYVLPYDRPVLLAAVYILCTCVTPMLSSHTYVRWFGIANVVAVAVTVAIEKAGFSSIWCFFAAFLSVLVFAHFHQHHQHRRHLHPTPTNVFHRQIRPESGRI